MFRKFNREIRTDANLTRVARGVAKGARALPAGTGRYLLRKIPAASWLPNYSIIWLIDDLIAGLSVGALLVPQALVFSAFSGIPFQNGLLASWLPGIIYAFMGTSKGMCDDLPNQGASTNPGSKISASDLHRQPHC